MKKFLPLFIFGTLFIFLLVFPTQTLEASKKGLVLWFDVLLPTLLPFLITSQLIMKTQLIEYADKFLGPFFSSLFHCSKNGAFCILCGFLCGYPVGARLIALQIQDKKLSIEEGQYLLSFCNNVSPMFCISYGIIYGIGSSDVLPYLLMIYGSALFFGLLTRPDKTANMISPIKKQTSSSENIFQLIDVCIIDSFLIMIKLCGYLILFTIISKSIGMILPQTMVYTSSLINSFLEITGGLSSLSALSSGTLRTAFCIGALSFGGLCCILQTNSVIAGTRLSIGKYTMHKAMITLLALLFFFLWNFFFHFFSINGRS